MFRQNRTDKKNKNNNVKLPSNSYYSTISCYWHTKSWTCMQFTWPYCIKVAYESGSCIMKFHLHKVLCACVVVAGFLRCVAFIPLVESVRTMFSCVSETSIYQNVRSLSECVRIFPTEIDQIRIRNFDSSYYIGRHLNFLFSKNDIQAIF